VRHAMLLAVVTLCLSAAGLIGTPPASAAAAVDCAARAGPSVNWAGCDKSGASLNSAQLSGADLRGTNFTRARLDFANLDHANLALLRAGLSEGHETSG
jgi:uncharacterized protein YjbI with pentapeptide repeats